MEESKRRLLEKIDDWFVVLEIDVVGKFFQSLFQELVLLLFEYVANVQLLKLFVGEVYEELLERVVVEYLESENIQQSDTFSEGGTALILQIYLLHFYFLIEF